MSNEIKQGDKVRVSRDIPQFYLKYNSYRMFEIEHRVVDVNMEDGFALLDSIPPKFTTILPTKYLVKVDAEAKKPKYRIGDKVRKKKWDKDTTISYVEWHGTWQTYVYRFAEQEYGFNCHKEVDIALVSRRAKEPKFQAGDCVKISFEWGELPVGEKLVIKRLETIDCRNAYMYSIEGYGGTVIESMLHSYTEPTEQTEAEKPNVGSIKIPVEVDLTDGFWDAYTADLAKEIALKVANKFNAPHEAADYAVKVAKAVVEGLKKK